MKLLFLTHRIPYPPNKGDKISSFNMMRFLSQKNDIYLGTFIDNEDDWQYLPKLDDYCKEVCAQRLNGRIGAMGALLGLLKNLPLSIGWYRNRRLQQWVDRILTDVKPDAVLMFSAATGQFIYGKTPEGMRTIFDAEDVDSEKFRVYAKDKSWPFSLIYRHEARRLLAYERRMAQSFDSSVFVSKDEADLFKSLCPEAAEKITYRTQGVDIDFFNPAHDLPTPFKDDEKALVFVGAMNYWPNIQAAEWYVSEVLPQVRKAHPDATFYIVGMAPTAAVRKLAETPGVVVTGSVDDVRPYVKHAWAVCLPLQLARGIQNKALEAMAMEKRIIATSAAMVGIELTGKFKPLIADDAQGLVKHSISVLSQEIVVDKSARQLIVDQYSWDANLKILEDLIFDRKNAAPKA